MMTSPWDNWDLPVPTPGGAPLIYQGWRHKQIWRSAYTTSQELKHMASVYGSQHASRALMLDWETRGLRGTGPLGRIPNMYHTRSLMRGGIPIDQVILHSGEFGPGWKPKSMGARRFMKHRLLSRVLPGVGWALLAYDAYDILVNRSFWGFKFD